LPIVIPKIFMVGLGEIAGNRKIAQKLREEAGEKVAEY
jgi:hypothetical protein